MYPFLLTLIFNTRWIPPKFIEINAFDSSTGFQSFVSTGTFLSNGPVAVKTSTYLNSQNLFEKGGDEQGNTNEKNIAIEKETKIMQLLSSHNNIVKCFGYVFIFSK